jgi:three-Cys-motif partner protein
MPKVDNVGYGELTPLKIDVLSKIFDYHLSVTQAVIRKNPYYRQIYRYIDTTAGKGYTPDGKIIGSPLVFLNSTISQNLQIPFMTDLIECEDENYTQLEANVAKHCLEKGLDLNQVHFHLGKYEDNVLELLPTRNELELGLVFVDPSGNLPNFETLSYISRVRPRMEILIYIPTTNVKRQGGKLLSDYMAEMGKKYWLVRKPLSWDKHKWTFLLGTSHPSILKDYKKIEFIRLGSPEAQKFFPKLNLTAKQRMKQIQPELPFPGQDN